MNLEIENGNQSRNPELAGFFVDFTKKDIGLIGGNNSSAEAEFTRNKAGGINVEIEAKRSGPRSSAQTPALPSEKKKGSEKNNPGSAGKKSSDAISFSNKVVEALKNKVKEHNARHSRKVTLSQLKKVYRRGAGAFSSSHRPGKTRGQWAMARVNMFLRMMSGGKVKDAYRKADQDVAKGSANFIDVSDSWEPEDQDMAQAMIDVESIGDFDFENADELYLEEYSGAEKWYEI